MAIITFTSDFGIDDYYVASVKGKIYSISQNIKITDITHTLKKFSITEAAYILKSVYRDFPKGTVHLVCVGRNSAEEKILALKLDDYYFVGPDNGIFSLISDKPYTAVVDLKKDIANNNFHFSFPEKTTFANAAAALANGVNIYNLGPQVNEIKTMLNRQLRITKSQIAGNVIHIDSYGNAVTNITRDVFEKVCDNRKYEILIRREKIFHISEHYYEAGINEIVALFNSSNLLEIAICEASIHQMQGLEADSPVFINFL